MPDSLRDPHDTPARTRTVWARAREPVSGYTHLAGLFAALLGAAWLLWREAGTPATRVGALAYIVGLVAVYGASAAYHLVNLGERVTRVLRRFDHAAIFVLIAGTATPVYVHALHGTERASMLWLLWGLAGVGIVFRTLWLDAPRWVYVSAYVATGFVTLVRWRALAASTPPQVLSLMLTGGVVYVVGALVYATRWPDPLPQRLGFHEIWHGFVLAASGLHFAAVAAIV